MQVQSFTTELKHYRTLKNGIRVAFVQANKSHKNARKACISVTLNQGHFHATDFPEGFAHLYEHMLFNASTKYRNTNELDNHLFTCHGQVNGWTQDLLTNFQLNCDQEGFLKACEILIDRLSAPLFELEDIEREITAIDAEFMSIKRDPVRQLLSVQKETCNRKHPFSNFSTGNKSTLNVLDTLNTQSELFAYHELVMRGQNICLCIGLPPLENVEYIQSSLIALLNEAFQTKTFVKSKQVCFPAVYEKPQLNNLIQVHQNEARHQLIVTFINAHSEKHAFYKHRNSLYVMVCHLIESKHELGLFCILKEKSLVHDIHCYYKAIDQRTDELVISLHLTEQGAVETAEIYDYIQHFITFLNRSGIEPWRFREKSSQYETSLHMNKGSSLLEDCIDVSQGMIQKGIISSAQYNDLSVEFFVENHITDNQPWLHLPDVLSKLTAENTRVYFISSTALTERCTKHFDTPYKVEKLVQNGQTLTSNSPKYVMPRQNPYMSSEHPMVHGQLPPTELLHLHSQQVDFKFYQDLRFHLPNGECYISITEPAMYESLAQIAAKRVWLSCLNEFLASKFFDVELASIHFRIYAHHHGISIHTGGLSERQLLLCIELVNEVRHYKASLKDVERHLSKTIANMRSRPKQRPLNRLFAYLNEYYQHSEKKQSAVLEKLLSICINDIYELQNQYFKHNYIESLLIGNWSVESAKRFNQQLNSRFVAAPTVTKPCLTISKIKRGQHIHKQLEDSPSGHFVWHFIPLLDDQEKLAATTDPQIKLTLSARSLVLEKLLSHTMFEVLRQNQKMGYELGVGYKPIGRYPGIAIYVVSSTHSISEIYKAMLIVINNTQQLLADECKVGSKLTLNKIVKELIKQVSPRDTDISQTASRTWLHFEDENPILGYQDLIDALRRLETNEIICALETLATTDLGQIILTSSNQKAYAFNKFNRKIKKEVNVN